MRYVLVILYFTAIHYILSPASPPDIVEEVVPMPTRGEPRRAAEAPAFAPSRVWEAPARTVSEPSAPAAAELASVAPDGGPMRAVETAGEQHTATFATPEVAERGESVERLVQNELLRLACFTGTPTGYWGKKSRAALRLFLDRAKTTAADPDETLLRLLRSYPENYCKLCRPGPTACAIEAMSAPQERSDTTPPVAEPVPSYLPPWMQGEKLAQAEEGPVQSDVPETAILPAPAPEVRKPQRRRIPRSSFVAPRSSFAAPRSSFAAPKRSFWTALSAWLKGR